MAFGGTHARVISAQRLMRPKSIEQFDARDGPNPQGNQVINVARIALHIVNHVNESAENPAVRLSQN